MLLEDAQALAYNLILNQTFHPDYPWVCDLDDTYKMFITGIGIEKRLQNYVRSEDIEAFAQRVRLTQSITPAVASGIQETFNKVSRIDRVRKDVLIKNPNKKSIVEEMMRGFYGSPKKLNKGVDYWFKTRFQDLSFLSPNGWIVLEWDAVLPSQIIRPRPMEVTAREAMNFKVVNDDVKWLFIKQSIKYSKLATTDATTPTKDIPGHPGTPYPSFIKFPAIPTTSTDGVKYTLYDEDFTVVFEQVDPVLLKQTGYNSQLGEFVLEIKSKHYLVKSFTPRLGFAPAYRIGYKSDPATNGRTFVNPWHSALCFFEKSLKTVSELDLSTFLHANPQRWQYARICPGGDKPNQKCNGGWLPDGKTKCKRCGGLGYKKVPTSAQDVMILPLPENATDADIINLEKLSITKSPPVELLRWQNEYVLQLTAQANATVFKPQDSNLKLSNTGKAAETEMTAFQVDANIQGIYDALKKYSEKWSELWIDWAVTFGVLAGVAIENVDAFHIFPADMKLKNVSLLMVDLKFAGESGAPGFLISNIHDDIADIVLAGDDLGRTKYNVKAKFTPFPGKNADEITFALSSQYVPEETKVLHLNFDPIFREIDFQHIDFWFMDYAQQREIVTEMVKVFQEKVKVQAPQLVLDGFREKAPVDQDDETALN